MNRDYIDRLKILLDEVAWEPLDAIIAAIKQANVIYVCGNGGSAANAAHLTLHLRELDYDARDLMADHGVMTAYSNDFAYESVLQRQLRPQGTKNDVLVAFSGSGDSANIVMALAEARRIGMATVGFLGFGGGMAKQLCDVVLICYTMEYGLLEDCHSACIHIIRSTLAE